MKKLIIKIIIIFVLFPTISFAAELFFEPAQVEGDRDILFKTSLIVDMKGENINVIAGIIKIPSGLRLNSIDFENSIIKYWIEKPSVSVDAIIFSGIIPGGFIGHINPNNETVFAPGVLFNLVLSSNVEKSNKLAISSPEILLNDGFGTSAIIITNNFVYKFKRDGDILEYFPVEDLIPPENIEAKIIKSPAFDKKKVIIFNGFDSGSGISHFEIKEGRRDWLIVESPYILKSQFLNTPIKLKVIDNSGNITIVDIERYGRIFNYFIVFILAIILLFFTLHYVKTKNKRKQ